MSKNMQQAVVCFGCHKEFKKSPSHVRPRNFCSKACIKGVGVRSRPFAVCHPDRPHHAKGWCPECWKVNYYKVNRAYISEKSRNYAKRHPEQVIASQRKYCYGITPDKFSAKFKAQCGLCAICHTRAATDVDHRHVPHQVRDLLCGPCNRAIGLLRECPAIVYSAAEYLEKWDARGRA